MGGGKERKREKRKFSTLTYRPRVERLIQIGDIIVDVVVVVEIIRCAGGIVVARIVVIRVVPIVVLIVLVQHHSDEHFPLLPRPVPRQTINRPFSDPQFHSSSRRIIRLQAKTIDIPGRRKKEKSPRIRPEGYTGINEPRERERERERERKREREVDR